MSNTVCTTETTKAQTLNHHDDCATVVTTSSSATAKISNVSKSKLAHPSYGSIKEFFQAHQHTVEILLDMSSDLILTCTVRGSVDPNKVNGMKDADILDALHSMRNANQAPAVALQEQPMTEKVPSVSVEKIDDWLVVFSLLEFIIRFPYCWYRY